MVVAYRMAPLSWLLLRPLIRTEFAALPNILAGRALVPELIQDAATPEAMAGALQPLLQDGDEARQQVRSFAAIHARLRGDYARRSALALAGLAAGTLETDHG
jgi:lipid-A-disaccharide synthase